MNPLTSSLVGVVFGVLAAASSVPGATGSASNHEPEAAQTLTLYVIATDKNGLPVTDLQAADFEIKMAGKTTEVASAQAASL